MIQLIDLRSDTLTKPTEEMRAVMARAEVGDDVFGEDPTVNRLQEKVAVLFGKEAALFVASGTMGNQVCLNAYTQPGDEVICDYNSHIFNYEGGAPAVLSGVQLHPIPGKRGIIDASQIEAVIRPADHHYAHSKLIAIENTHNRGGGAIFPLQKMQDIYKLAQKHRLKVHLDGARIWHAAIATGTPLSKYGKCVDSISVCLSKGLGAPVGSVVVGSADFIDRAHRYRKIYGGGMRQAGILAAAGIYAIDHHYQRLADDHRRAKQLADELSRLPGIEIDPAEVETNLVIFKVDVAKRSPGNWCRLMKEEDILMLPFGYDRVRMVTHLHITDHDIDVVTDRFKKM
ncbi:MAG TPA: low-specificity L-threonine aldolase [Bacteroidetes bacterium]|nr:low-specificity L-threonine aldolase [Bacteroidota bacterium]